MANAIGGKGPSLTSVPIRDVARAHRSNGDLVAAEKASIEAEQILRAIGDVVGLVDALCLRAELPTLRAR
jgi:hypothetical protein